jgi:CheY-like chemotaxis protein
LRKQPKCGKTPIIVFSAYTEEFATEALAAGANAVLSTRVKIS